MAKRRLTALDHGLEGSRHEYLLMGAGRFYTPQRAVDECREPSSLGLTNGSCALKYRPYLGSAGRRFDAIFRLGLTG